VNNFRGVSEGELSENSSEYSGVRSCAGSSVLSSSVLGRLVWKTGPFPFMVSCVDGEGGSSLEEDSLENSLELSFELSPGDSHCDSQEDDSFGDSLELA